MRTPVRAGLALALTAAALSVSGVAEPTASAAPSPAATVVDSVGTEFWTAFPRSLGGEVQTLFVSPEGNGTVTITTATGALVETRSLTAGQVEAVPIPNARSVTGADTIGDQGLHVEATTPVSVYGVSYLVSASTGFQAFPVDALGTTHRVLSYPGVSDGPYGSRLTVVATADDTTVTITPERTIGGRTGGVAYEVELDEGQTYQLQDPGDVDVSGTAVDADKPITVLAGTGCAYVPVGVGACNPLLQQMTPTTAWGTTFVSARLAVRTKGDTYRVLADHDGTVVRVNGVEKATLDAGEIYEAVLPEGATTDALAGVLIETSEPSFVAQYGNGTNYDSTTGDPLMMSVPPVDQYLDSYVVAAPDVDASMTAYIGLVAPTADLSEIRVDGDVVGAAEWVAVPGSTLSVARLQVATGQHAISSPNGVGVNVYEWGVTDGFGFTGGQGIRTIVGPPAAPLPPAPLAAALSSTGVGTAEQSVTVDLADGQWFVLLDSGSEAMTVSVPGQGTYALAASAGRITFRPVAGFAGAATPITYRVLDRHGRYADATYAPTVTPPDAPPAEPLSSTGVGTAEQSVTVDLADGQRVVLVDGGSETTTVSVPGQGTYILDPATGRITFRPVLGFAGAATPVTYRLVDEYDQVADAPYTPTVTPPAAPTAEPQRAQAPDTPTVTLQVPAGGRSTLISGGSETRRVSVPGGTYVLDPSTHTVRFIARPGFRGSAAPVTFRILDAYGQYADAELVATIVAAWIALPSLAKASGGDASTPVRCRVTHTRLRSCSVTLTARVDGRRTVIGEGTWRGASGRVTLNRAGRAVAATPGGTRIGARLVARTADGVLRARDSGRLVLARFTLDRTFRFPEGAVTVPRADRARLERIGDRAGRPASVVCTGHTDSRGPAAANLAISQRRAAAVCAALGLSSRVRTVIVGKGESQPVASNATAAGRAENRRVEITFHY